MKKFLLSLMITVSTVASVMADDIIYFSNGSTQRAFILEVRGCEVFYKRSDMCHSPVYSSTKNAIYMIEYQNGYKEIFAQQNNYYQNNRCNIPNDTHWDIHHAEPVINNNCNNPNVVENNVIIINKNRGNKKRYRYHYGFRFH